MYHALDNIRQTKVKDPQDPSRRAKVRTEVRLSRRDLVENNVESKHRSAHI